MAIVVTDQGISAIRNADAGGFLINLASFKLTSEENFTPEVTDESLVGAVIFSGDINEIEALGTNSVKLTLSLPKNFPLTGSVFLSELGIYLESGELFAHGKLATAFEKTAEFGFDIYVIVSAARLGDVIQVTDSLNCSIAATPHVRTLLPPMDSLKNVVSVLDELHDYRGRSTGSIAVKFGSGSLHWAFVGYTRMYSGFPGSVNSFSEFDLDIESDAGFWLNDNEIVIVQVISGPGAGQSRKVKYNKTSSFEVLEKPFTNLTDQSNISIWRSYENLLPTRSPAIPDYFVLQKGQNNWGEQIIESASGALRPYRFSLNGPGNNFITIPANIVSQLSIDTSADLVTVHKNGTLVSQNTYAVLYNGSGKPDRIQFNTVNTPSDVMDVLAFGYDESDGASLYWYEAEYDAVATTSFALPIIPEDTTGILAYLNGALQTDFTLVGANVVFNSPIVGKLCLLPFVNYEDMGIMPKLTRRITTAYAGQQSVDTFATIGAKKDTLVYVDKLYVPKSSYDIQDNRVIVFKTPLTSGVSVETFVYYSDIVSPTVISTTGRDSGPQWADPAGLNALSNSIEAFSYQGVTGAAITSFTTERVLNASYLLVFLDGSYQYPNKYVFTQFTDRSVIRLNEVMPAGMDVDIIAFKEVEGPGTKIEGVTNRFTLSSSSTYTIPLSADMLASSWMLFIGGVYQHRITYDLNHTTGMLTLYNVPAGMSGVECEFQYFTAVEEVGVRTDFGTFTSSLNTAVGRNRLAFPIDDVQDTLVFIGSVYQNKNQYVTEILNQGQLTGYVNYVPDTVVAENGTEVCTFSLRSDLPRSRLVLRSEFEECCESMWAAIEELGGETSATLTHTFVGAVGQTVFTVANTLTDHIAVIVRGSELSSDDYTKNGSTITLQGIYLEEPTTVIIRDFGLPGDGGGSAGGGSTKAHYFTALAGQTTFTVSEGLSDNIAVIVRGVEISLVDFIRSGSDIILQGMNLQEGTPVVIRDFGAFSDDGGGSSSYTLPIASSTVLGGVKVGLGLAIDPTGVLSATGGSSGEVIVGPAGPAGPPGPEGPAGPAGAAPAVGAVGSIAIMAWLPLTAWLGSSNPVTLLFGATAPGSRLRYSTTVPHSSGFGTITGFTSASQAPTSPEGTWECMGVASHYYWSDDCGGSGITYNPAMFRRIL